MLSAVVAFVTAHVGVIGSLVAGLVGGGYVVPKVKGLLTSVEAKLAKAKADVASLEAKVKAKL